MPTGSSVIENKVVAREVVDPRREELEKILGSETFIKSPRLAALLKHICDRTWSNRIDELSEQQIGIHFFHRLPGFNAGEDAIVRGTARHLRKRLELFYETEGKTSRFRIAVPKGGYVARFETVESCDPPELTLPSAPTKGEPYKKEERQKFTNWASKFSWSAAVLSLLIGGVGLLLWSYLWTPTAANLTDGPPPLWKTLFQPNRRTVIVAGDAALNLYTAYKHRPVPLKEYTEQRYQHDNEIASISPEGTGLLSMINAATMSDLKVVSELVRVPYREHLPIADQNVEVRYARDLNSGDLNGANVILLGASTFNPWVSLYDNKLDFSLDRDFEHYTFRVLNRRPKAGEQAVITKENGQALTIVSLTETPSGNEHALLIVGASMGSIYAALHFLFTQRMWEPVIAGATQDGRLHDFEVVLKSDFLKDEVSNTRVFASHIH